MSGVKWIKISTDIFNNKKIKQIKSLPEGTSILLVWFELLVLAGNTNDNGLIYITKEIPYTEEMLSTEFGFSLTIIKMALNIFLKFEMIEIIDDIYRISNWEKYQNVDGLDKIREQTRNRVAKHRENKQQQLCNVTSNVTVTHCNALELDIEEDKDIYIYKEKKEINKEKKEKYFENEELNSLFLDFLSLRKKIKAVNSERAINMLLNKLNKHKDDSVKIEMINNSIVNSWKDIYELKKGVKNTNGENKDLFAETYQRKSKWN